MADFGAGIYLTDEFDFEVDESGDIRTTSGERELQKDVSFFLADGLEEHRGRIRDATTLKEIQVAAEDILITDPRVDEVLSVVVRTVDTEANKIEIICEVNSDTGEQELVIEVT